MLLRRLISELTPAIDLAALPDLDIRGICEDSRTAEPGDLFIARSGTKTEGARFIGDAAARGAVAVVCGGKIESCPLPQIVVPNPAAVAGPLAHIFYGHPSRQVKSIGVTGTNGKTTTTYILRHLLQKFAIPCGLIGTVETDDGKTRSEAAMTTPGAVDLVKLLAKMRDNGCRACAMEVSSHALHQGRVLGFDFSGAAFTNLTRDHLDYHGTMEKYADAKAILFHMLGPDAVAVVNADDSYAERMLAGCEARATRFGFGSSADYCAKDIRMTSRGSNFILHTPDGSAEVSLAMIGRHNIANALTAATIAGEVFLLSVHQIAAGLKDAPGAPGRLQPVDRNQPFAVLVDYAHTDDALTKALTALRHLTKGKLRVLFGCGGDRDRTKRPLMAHAAERNADAIYVTSDNPRTEDPRTIIEEIIAGFQNLRDKPIFVEADRRTAIAKILHDAQPGDVVLLAGKGHENYQIIGATKYHFDDVEEAAAVLEQLPLSHF